MWGGGAGPQTIEKQTSIALHHTVQCKVTQKQNKGTLHQRRGMFWVSWIKCHGAHRIQAAQRYSAAQPWEQRRMAEEGQQCRRLCECLWVTGVNNIQLEKLWRRTCLSEIVSPHLCSGCIVPLGLLFSSQVTKTTANSNWPLQGLIDMLRYKILDKCCVDVKKAYTAKAKHLC